MRKLALLCLLLEMTCLRCWAAPPEKVTIASKAFPESWVVGEAFCQLARGSGAQVDFKKSLGFTEVIYQALLQGSIDVYPEYVGTIKEVLLKDKPHPTDADVLSMLAKGGIGMSYPLGFSDSFAMAVPDTSPLQTLSDLAKHPELRVAMSSEFKGRNDGWPNLVKVYGLAPKSLTEMDHELCYQALAGGKVDVINVYTTDGQIAKLKLRVLKDDKQAFPRYDAVLLYRVDLPARAPRAWAAMMQMVGRVSEEQMRHANEMQVVEHKDASVAAQYLLKECVSTSVLPPVVRPALDWAMIGANTLQHLRLVGISLAFAIAVGIPLGIIASRTPLLASITLSGTGLLQTIPSLALLAFLVPIVGVGATSALIALFIYSLLPIVRNTYTGLTGLPGNLSEAAEAIGLSPMAQLWWVRLPMASPSILAGIKTSAVINVGTATLAALVGAGGLGQPILQGITLLDPSLIFQGAIPAAVLALVVQWCFDLLERAVVPRGLRL
jgi:osmoprotectant transport system permease protein